MKLDDFENELLESIENNEWKSKDEDLTKRTKELQRYIKNQKKVALSIRISENDIYELKKRALENAIPYQNIIQMLIHQYNTNQIRLSI
jgi:predicted DNA binding CopG/RHH family protein